MTLLLLPLAVLSFGMSLETSSHPMYCDLYNQCIQRENTFHRNGTDGEQLMTVYRYFTESDPFDELFRIFQTSFDSFRESIGLEMDSFVRINDVDRFSDQLGLKCKSTVQSGQWYRLEEVHCGTTEDEDLFSLKLLPTLSPTISPKTKASSHSQPSLLIGLGVLILFLVALIAIGVLVYRRQKTTSAFTNNPIVVRNTTNTSFPNYGTFSA